MRFHLPARDHGVMDWAPALDQSALYGVLAELEALGLVLLEVRQLEPPRISLESGDTRSP